MALQIHDKILDIGNKGFAAQTAPVFKLVYHKFRDVNGVEVDRPDHAAHQLVRGCHISGRDGVKLGCETDDGGCPARISPHGVLGFIDIGIDARQRAVAVSYTHLPFECFLGGFGVAFSKKAEKGALCFILGIVIIVFQAGSVIYGSLRTGFTADMILTLVAGLIIPGVYTFGAWRNMRSAQQA